MKNSILVFFISMLAVFVFTQGCSNTTAKLGKEIRKMEELKPSKSFNKQNNLAQRLKVIAVAKDKKTGVVQYLFANDRAKWDFAIIKSDKYTESSWDQEIEEMLKAAPTGDFWTSEEKEEYFNVPKEELGL